MLVFAGAADEFPIAEAEAEVAFGAFGAVVLLEEFGAAFGIGLAEERGKDVLAVQAGIGGERGAGEGGEGGGEVDGADDFPGDAGRDGAGPGGDEGGAGAGFKDGVFAAAEGSGGLVVAELGDGAVGISIVEDGTVVGAEEDEGVLGELVFFEGGDDFADAPIELEDGIAAEAGAAFALEALVGDAGDVVVVGGEEEEEGGVFVGGDELFGFLDPFVGEVFIAEACGGGTGVESDAADAVVDGGVVAVGPIHFEGVAVGDAGGLLGVDGFVADGERVGGVEVENAVVFNVDLGHAVVGGGEDEGLVEADFEGAGLELAIPIGLFVAEAEVPFADDSGAVSGGLEERWEGGGAGADDGGTIGRGDAGALLAEGVGAGEEGETSGRAGGGRGVTAGEALALGGEFVDVGGFESGVAVTGDIAVTEIIGHDDDDVGFPHLGVGDDGERQEENAEKDAGFHLSQLSREEMERARISGEEPGERNHSFSYTSRQGRVGGRVCFWGDTCQSTGCIRSRRQG